MAQPTLQNVHIDAPLSFISTAYIQSQDMFVAGKVFPRVPVEKASDKYFTYTKNDWFRDEAQVRADDSESVGSGYGVSTDSYTCDVFAFHKDVGQQVRANADMPLDMDRDAALYVTQKLLLRQELQWVTDFFASSIWGTDITPSNLWSNYATSDPISDVRTGKRTILATTGYEPNTLVLGYDVMNKLIDHPDIVDRIKYGSSSPDSPAIVNEAALAKIFGLGRVLTAKAIKATNNEGGTAAYDFAHGKNALLCYSAPNPGILTPSAGYTFVWRGLSQGLGTDVTIARIPMPWRGIGTERVEGQVAFDNKLVGSDLGYFFASCVS